MMRIWLTLLLAAQAAIVATAGPMTATFFGTQTSDSFPTQFFSIVSGSNTLSYDGSFAPTWTYRPIDVSTSAFLNPPPIPGSFIMNAFSNPTARVSLNGTLLDPFTYTLTLSFSMPAWTGGTVANQSGQVSGGGPVSWGYNLTGGVTSFIGSVELRNSAGACLLCESYTGTGTVSGVVQGILALGGGTNVNYSLSGQTIPEPSSYALAGLGLSVALWVRRRRSTI